MRRGQRRGQLVCAAAACEQGVTQFEFPSAPPRTQFAKVVVSINLIWVFAVVFLFGKLGSINNAPIAAQLIRAVGPQAVGLGGYGELRGSAIVEQKTIERYPDTCRLPA